MKRHLTRQAMSARPCNRRMVLYYAKPNQMLVSLAVFTRQTLREKSEYLNICIFLKKNITFMYVCMYVCMYVLTFKTLFQHKMAILSVESLGLKERHVRYIRHSSKHSQDKKKMSWQK